MLLGAATLVIAAGNDVSDTPLAAALAAWCGALLLSAAAVAVLPRRWWIAPAVLAALYAVSCLALALFQLGEPLGIDADFVLAAPRDSAKTLLRIVGWPATIGIGAAVLALVVALAMALRAVTPRSQPAARRFALLSAAGGLALLAFLGLPHAHLRKPPHRRDGESIRPFAVRYPPLPRANGESVFMVQLESVNGLIGQSGHVLHGRPVPADPMPAMHELARRGFFFPHFWSGAITTHRAQETILCGAVRNVHAPYFDQLIPWEGQCLPALLREAGYRTVFLSSYPDRTFGGTGKFMQRAGFEDIHFAGDLMKPGDPVTRWGYEERAFFRRAFEYLRARYRPDEPLFVYLAVCAHHFGFTRTAKTDVAYFLGDEMKKIEQYLWSQRQQDQSLLTFDRLLRGYKGDAAHVFYVPDHAFPLGLYGGSAPSMGATIDNFLTPLVYVPPEGRAADFEVGRTIPEMYGQTDLIPTIAELVSAAPYRNSLVPFLRRRPPPPRADYEPCHVMSQPYGGRSLLVARGPHAYQYHVATATFREFRIGGTPLRQTLVRESPMPYEEFERRYGCRRFPAS